MSADVLLAPFAGVLGLLIGSFLNVVIWRVPRGESVVRPPSHCPGCDTEIKGRDNVPLVSWLLLRGRCRHCQTRISARYPMVELLTAVLFTLVALRIGPRVAVVAFLYFAAIAVALAFIDYDTKRLPNVLTYPAYVVGPVLLAADAVVSGTWSPFVRALVGMAALFAFYFVLVLVYPAGMGGGDVKLAGVIGLFLGWIGYGALVVGAFLGFFIGGVWGVALIAAKKAGRKSAVPYGPFMLLGAMVAMFAGEPLTNVYLNALH
ncbi:MAG: peptidase domain protein [Frankiales bacterium]|nr:peptidase domain protein [Frankiales bacterium]